MIALESCTVCGVLSCGSVRSTRGFVALIIIPHRDNGYCTGTHLLKKENRGECEEARARRNKLSHRGITPGVLQQSGDRSRTRTRRTTQSSQCNWAWRPKRMAHFGRRRRQCSERPLPIHQRDRARGASAESAAHAAGTAGTTRRGAFRGLESKPPVWACKALTELTPGYDIFLC